MMSMSEKKICVLGAFAVGKTSLIQSFIGQPYSNECLPTVGVKIEKIPISISDNQINLMIWDVENEGDCTQNDFKYLRGSSGYILVADGSRPETLISALNTRHAIQTILPGVPSILALNKADLEDQWVIPPAVLGAVSDDLAMLKTSAKSGANVEQLFTRLSCQILNIGE